MAIDWRKYPLAQHTRLYLSEPHRLELDRLVADVRREERARCRATCRLVSKTVKHGAYKEGCLDCSAAIEALGDNGLDNARLREALRPFSDAGAEVRLRDLHNGFDLDDDMYTADICKFHAGELKAAHDAYVTASPSRVGPVTHPNGEVIYGRTDETMRPACHRRTGLGVAANLIDAHFQLTTDILNAEGDDDGEA